MITYKDLPKEFETFNEFNETVLMKHKMACEMNHLCAVHSVSPLHIFVNLGGFKLMYPLFEKSMSSNLLLLQKADIWIQLFKILRSLMNRDPSHIKRLFINRNLIGILKYCIIRAGISK